VEQRLGKEAWLWTALLGLSYATTFPGVFLAFWLLPPESLFDGPLWLLLTVFVAGALVAGLVISVPSLLVMKRLQLWVLPRLGMGLPVGKPTIPLRLGDLYRFGWGMSTGDGRFVTQHLEMVRTASVFAGAEEGLPSMREEYVAAIRRAARRGQWWKIALGMLAGLAIGGAFVLASETGLTNEALWLMPALMLVLLPLAVLLGAWPNIKAWTRAYLAWVAQHSQA
jgi:hypothetical protein